MICKVVNSKLRTTSSASHSHRPLAISVLYSTSPARRPCKNLKDRSSRRAGYLAIFAFVEEKTSRVYSPTRRDVMAIHDSLVSVVALCVVCRYLYAQSSAQPAQRLVGGNAGKTLQRGYSLKPRTNHR